MSKYALQTNMKQTQVYITSQESQLARGKPVGYLQSLEELSTRLQTDPIPLVVRRRIWAWGLRITSKAMLHSPPWLGRLTSQNFYFLSQCGTPQNLQGLSKGSGRGGPHPPPPIHPPPIIWSMLIVYTVIQWNSNKVSLLLEFG